jgi:signal transduction histidine kinase
MAARMDRQATRLASLINEMMDVGRIHLGRLEFQLAQMDLVALVREVIARMTGVLSQAGCPIVLCEQGPVVGRWNHDKLGQVVASLLANSIKFAPGQPIEISISKLDGRARLTVTDHGIGIDAEALPHIFEKFKRAVSCSQYGGLGLGLYIARNLVEALGGTVHAESVPGLETTFTVELPLAGPKQPSPQAPPS